MQVRALTTFSSKYGFIRKDDIFTIEPNYLHELNKTIPQVEEIGLFPAPKPAKAKPGKVDSTGLPPALSPDDPKAEIPDAGTVPPSSASPPGRRSRKRT